MTDVRTSLRMQGSDLVVHSYQDAEEIVERNKALKGEKQSGDFHHIGSIPCNVLMQWLQEEWNRGNVNLRFGSAEFRRIVTKKLNDHDWLFLRTDK